MFTLCPNCQTLFRIRIEQLRAAAGKAHCSHCNGIFNAVENLFEEDPASPGLGQVDPTVADDIPLFDAVDGVDSQELNAFDRDGFEELSVPARGSIDIDVDLDQLEMLEQPVEHEQVASSTAATQAPLASVATDTGKDNTSRHAPPALELPFTVPDNLPDIEPTDPDKKNTGGNKRRTLAWSLLVVVLLLSALGQAAWLWREQLMNHPMAREILLQVCRQVGCQLEARTAPDKFEVAERSVKTHPELPSVLQIHLTFVNGADFPQPYPQIRLSLYSNNNELIARRRFKPEEYLGIAQDQQSLLSAGQSVRIELALEDPGEQATGFKFDFL